MYVFTPKLHYLSLHSQAAMPPLLLLLLLPLTINGVEPPRGCLDSGACYVGSWNSTSKGKEYASFQGIRYAQPPVGEKRFVPPQPFIAEEREYDVSVESTIVCPQTSALSPIAFGDEDCLMLNVYVPDTDTLDPIPVMVWIHGGGLRQVEEQFYSLLNFCLKIQGANTYDRYGPQLFLDR